MWFTKNEFQELGPPPFDIGDELIYLGIKMVVIQIIIGVCGGELIDGLICEYINKNGDIKDHRFYPCSYEALIKENDRGRAAK